MQSATASVRANQVTTLVGLKFRLFLIALLIFSPKSRASRDFERLRHDASPAHRLATSRAFRPWHNYTRGGLRSAIVAINFEACGNWLRHSSQAAQVGCTRAPRTFRQPNPDGPSWGGAGSACQFASRDGPEACRVTVARREGAASILAG
jgi:hypothetical protein